MIYGAARFWAKTRTTESGCREWQAFVAPNGYGTFWDRGKNRLAHRSAYEFAVGAIPVGLQVCHTCDNRKCVNPDHLFLGTQSDNMIDCVRKGRLVDNSLDRHGMARFTSEQVISIRKRLSLGNLQSVIAQEYGVHPSTISRIKSGSNWGQLSSTE